MGSPLSDFWGEAAFPALAMATISGGIPGVTWNATGISATLRLKPTFEQIAASTNLNYDLGHHKANFVWLYLWYSRKLDEGSFHANQTHMFGCSSIT